MQGANLTSLEDMPARPDRPDEKKPCKQGNSGYWLRQSCQFKAGVTSKTSCRCRPTVVQTRGAACGSEFSAQRSLSGQCGVFLGTATVRMRRWTVKDPTSSLSYLISSYVHYLTRYADVHRTLSNVSNDTRIFRLRNSECTGRGRPCMEPTHIGRYSAEITPLGGGIDIQLRRC